MKVPYIRIHQRNEVFYTSKFKVSVLLEKVDFSFREPYKILEKSDVVEKNEKYLEKIRRIGIEMQSNEEGIQRRLQLERIKDISNYIQNHENNFFPNSIILSADVSFIDDFEEKYLSYESQEIGYFEFPDNIRFSVIDGQHRLAGLSQVKDIDLLENFELPVTILFNVSRPTAAKLFSDINGKQKSVNRSLIYDLYSEMDETEFKEIKIFHTICENLYSDRKSPLFRQIKMLGIGSGAISQAFFIDYVSAAVNKTDLIHQSKQYIYNHLFMYYRAYQTVFPEDWPMPLGDVTDTEIDNHSIFVLKERRSQLVKTNGFGAIMRAFPLIYDKSEKDFKNYIDIVAGLKSIEWKVDNIGTGKSFQNIFYEKIKERINLS